MDSILRHYGITSTQRVTHHGILGDTIGQFDLGIQAESILNLSPTHDIILFSSLFANKIADRYISASELLNKRYHLVSTVICEQRYKTFEGSNCISAVNVSHDQIAVLFRTMMDLPNHSFAIVVKKVNSQALSHQLLHQWQNGILIPSVLKECCNTAISYNALFLHIIVGSDGYSINCLERQGV